MDGLIIKPKWCNKILHHYKSLEVRGSKTAKLNQKLYLLESKTNRVKGTFKIVDVIPVNKENWETYKYLHQVFIDYEELLQIYKTPYFWKLSEIEEFSDTMFYEHPKGAVIWVKDVDCYIE